jgi:hypothetical protein
MAGRGAKSGHSCDHRGLDDPDGNSWAVQELKVRAAQPLIPVDYRNRFGADE